MPANPGRDRRDRRQIRNAADILCVRTAISRRVISFSIYSDSLKLKYLILAERPQRRMTSPKRGWNPRIVLIRLTYRRALSSWPALSPSLSLSTGCKYLNRTVKISRITRHTPARIRLIIEEGGSITRRVRGHIWSEVNGHWLYGRKVLLGSDPRARIHRLV